MNSFTVSHFCGFVSISWMCLKRKWSLRKHSRWGMLLTFAFVRSSRRLFHRRMRSRSFRQSTSACEILGPSTLFGNRLVVQISNSKMQKNVWFNCVSILPFYMLYTLWYYMLLAICGHILCLIIFYRSTIHVFKSNESWQTSTLSNAVSNIGL